MKKNPMRSILVLGLLAVVLLAGCGEQTAQTGAPAAANSTAQATQPVVTYLTAEEAEAIALAHAGVSAGQAARIHTEFDRDYGVAEYDVEFLYDGWEYEYEINAETGEILTWDKEVEQ